MFKFIVLLGFMFPQITQAQLSEVTEQNLKFIRKSIKETDKDNDPYFNQAAEKKTAPKKVLAPVKKVASVQEGQPEMENKLQNLYVDCKSHKNPEACDQFKKLDKEYVSSFGDTFEPLEPLDQINSTKMETCEWSSELPRRVIEVPGCAVGVKTKACVGYVVCENQSGVKFVRMSTCSPQNCGDKDAVACTKEKGYSSKNMGEFNTSSKKIDEILINSKSSRK